MGYRRFPHWFLLTFLTFVACAPRATQVTQPTPEPPPLVSETAEERELERVARMAHHRMELAFLDEGSYTTNALLDLRLPQGTRWTLEDFTGDRYLIRFVSENVPHMAWLISPEGVSATPR